MGIFGEDWASYQDNEPSTAGLSFFFVKVTQGQGYINPKWRAQYAHGVANGLVPGKYHYPDMRNSPISEADYFLEHADIQPGDMVCLDWEGYDQANASVPKATQAAFKDAFLRHAKSRVPHNPVGPYCNTDYWRNVDATSYYCDFLWIATAGLPAGQPGIQAPWLFHQYSAASVDHDYCHLGSTAELRAWALSFEPSAPKPPPVKPPVVTPIPPTPTPTEDPEMFIVAVDRTPYDKNPANWPGEFLLTSDGQLKHIVDPADLAEFQKLGIKGPVTISVAQYESLVAGK